MRRSKHLNGVAVAVAMSAILAGGGAALAVTRAPASSSTIAACYLNTTAPGKAVLEHIASNGSCPHGYKKITWNAQGPQGNPGQPGVTDGLTDTNLDTVNLPIANSLFTVLTSPAAPVTGVYYVSANLTMQVDAGVEIGCYSPQQSNDYVASATQGSTTGFIVLPVNFDVMLKAGATTDVVCEVSAANGAQFNSGYFNAILVNHTTSADVARPAAAGRLALPQPSGKAGS